MCLRRPPLCRQVYLVLVVAESFAIIGSAIGALDEADENDNASGIRYVAILSIYVTVGCLVFAVDSVVTENVFQFWYVTLTGSFISQIVGSIKFCSTPCTSLQVSVCGTFPHDIICHLALAHRQSGLILSQVLIRDDDRCVLLFVLVIITLIATTLLCCSSVICILEGIYLVNCFIKRSLNANHADTLGSSNVDYGSKCACYIWLAPVQAYWRKRALARVLQDLSDLSITAEARPVLGRFARHSRVFLSSER